jgi:hypothetical protein
MSTMHELHNITLTASRPPSHALIMRMLGVSLAAGYQAIDLKWRDQTIELLFHDKAKKWEGLGSINQESGHDIARELSEIRQFVLDHFQVITVGHARG